jgi:chromate reductase
MKTTKILAICGSLKSTSTNKAILLASSVLAPSNCEIKLFSGLDLLPHFNPDLEDEIIPALVHFRQELKDSDAVLISSPEYAHGIPGTLKNALDWVVGTSEFVEKPVGIIAATPMYEGRSFALESLVEILKTMSAKVEPEAILAISKVKSKLDELGNITDLKTKEDITSLINFLIKSVK